MNFFSPTGHVSQHIPFSMSAGMGSGQVGTRHRTALQSTGESSICINIIAITNLTKTFKDTITIHVGVSYMKCTQC